MIIFHVGLVCWEPVCSTSPHIILTFHNNGDGVIECKEREIEFEALERGIQFAENKDEHIMKKS